MQRNRLEVVGYLAAKPALRRLPSGTPVANVRLGDLDSLVGDGVDRRPLLLCRC